MWLGQLWMPRSPLTTSSVPDSRVPSSRIRRECLMSISRMTWKHENYMLQVEVEVEEGKVERKVEGQCHHDFEMLRCESHIWCRETAQFQRVQRSLQPCPKVSALLAAWPPTVRPACFARIRKNTSAFNTSEFDHALPSMIFLQCGVFCDL